MQNKGNISAITKYLQFIEGFEPPRVAVDKCHNVLIFGIAISLKPTTILEIGIGSGYVTRCLLAAIDYNQIGSLTCVDNWHDWGGVKPDSLPEGPNIITASEQDFVKTCPSDSYDLVVSDADHQKWHTWLDDLQRITRRNGIIFIHDTNKPVTLPKLTKYQFVQSSLPNERCERGLLMVLNDKVKLL